MSYFAGGAMALSVLFLLARAYTSADPRALVRAVRYGIGSILLLVGVVLVLGERWGLGGVVIAAGVSVLATGRIGPFDLGGGVRTQGSESAVRSHWFEMILDHDSGAMNGEVLRGKYAGRWLNDLDEAELMKLAEEVGSAGDSAALLEAYLDRRISGWRENVEGDGAARPGSAADSGPMTDEQAYQILGLFPGATEAEIRAAHRRLMKAVHPDQGGSTFLAAKINQAKDWLLGKHR